MLPGDFSKAHAVANFQTFPISDRTREIIVVVALLIECLQGAGVPKGLRALFYSVLTATF